MFYGARPARHVSARPGEYGLHRRGRPPGRAPLQPPDRQARECAGKAVAPDHAGILAGYHSMVAGAGGTLVANPASTDPGRVSTREGRLRNGAEADRRRAPKAHPRSPHLGRDRGQKGLPDGYVPLPSELAAPAGSVVGGISVTVTAADDTDNVRRNTRRPAGDCPETFAASVGRIRPRRAAPATAFVGGSVPVTVRHPDEPAATPAPATKKTTVGKHTGDAGRRSRREACAPRGGGGRTARAAGVAPRRELLAGGRAAATCGRSCVRPGGVFAGISSSRRSRRARAARHDRRETDGPRRDAVDFVRRGPPTRGCVPPPPSGHAGTAAEDPRRTENGRRSRRCSIGGS